MLFLNGASGGDGLVYGLVWSGLVRVWKHLRGRFLFLVVAGFAFPFCYLLFLFSFVDTMYPTKRSPSLE